MSVAAFTPASALLTADSPSVTSAYGAPQWGIFDGSGNPVLTADSVAAFGFQRDYRISDYPQEEGKFESYNKVQVPYEARVEFLIAATRYDFLNSVEAACASLNFVTVVTPEVPYANANLKGYRYRREANNGMTLIRVIVTCEEVRIPTQPAQNGQVANGATASTNAASPTTSGLIQGTATQGPVSATNANLTGPFTTNTSSLAVQPVSADGYTALPQVPSTNLPGDSDHDTGRSAKWWGSRW